MKKNRKLIIAVIALVVVIAALLCVYALTRPETAQGAKGYTLEVIHSDGSTKTFELRTDEEYLGPALVAEGIIAGEESQFGLTIITVDGEDAVWETDNAYWSIMVNGAYGETGVDSTPVHDGDVFQLVYTKM